MQTRPPQSSATQAITRSFLYVRVFGSVENWGHHFLASDSPIPLADAATLAARMPQAAVSDLIEWGPERSAEGQLQLVLAREVSPQTLIGRRAGHPSAAGHSSGQRVLLRPSHLSPVLELVGRVLYLEAEA